MRSLRFVAVLAISAQVAFAQQAGRVASSLSLEEAISTARQNNPKFLTDPEQRADVATSQVRQAYSALLADSERELQRRSYQQAGTQYVRAGARRQRRHVPVVVQPRRELLHHGRSGVRSAAGAREPRGRGGRRRQLGRSARALSDQSVHRRAQVAGAGGAAPTRWFRRRPGSSTSRNAKMKVGAGTIVDIRTAEVAVGQAQVNQLTAHNQAVIEKMRLFQFMGVPADTGRRSSRRSSRSRSPASRSIRSSTSRAASIRTSPPTSRGRFAAEMDVRAAQTGYLPSLSVGTGWGGNSFVVRELGYSWSAAAVNRPDRQQMRVLPLARLAAHARRPARARLRHGTLTQGRSTRAMQREQHSSRSSSPGTRSSCRRDAVDPDLQRLLARSAARAGARDARQRGERCARARNLQLTTDVTQAYLNSMTAAKTVQLQEQNAAKAAEELAFVEERYRVGAATFLDVTTSRGIVRNGADRPRQLDLRLSQGVRRARKRGRASPPLRLNHHHG